MVNSNSNTHIHLHKQMHRFFKKYILYFRSAIQLTHHRDQRHPKLVLNATGILKISDESQSDDLSIDDGYIYYMNLKCNIPVYPNMNL